MPIENSAPKTETGEETGYSNFRCTKCERLWVMTFPLPMIAQSFTSLLAGIRCPECGAANRHIRMSEAAAVPADPEAKQVKITGCVCIHCELQMFAAQDETPEAVLEKFKHHDSICEKHPLMQRVRELEAKLAQ